MGIYNKKKQLLFYVLDGGEVTHSVIGNDLCIHKGVKIKNSVLMDKCIIK